MAQPPTPPGAPQLIRILITASLWLIRRPFLIQRWALHLGAVALLALSAVLVVSGNLWAAIPLALLCLVACHLWPGAVRPALHLWRRARPEDPYLATWLSRHALVRGDMRTAERWNTYATSFADTNRLIAHTDLVVVLALMEDSQAADLSAFLGRHLDWLQEQGVPHVRASASIALDQLLDAAPNLRSQPQMAAALALLAQQNVESATVGAGQESPPRETSLGEA